MRRNGKNPLTVLNGGLMNLDEQARAMIRGYHATGFTEIDGLCGDFFMSRIPDLQPTNDAQADGEYRPIEEWLLMGTCPRCHQRTFYANDVKGVWQCQTCNQGGGVVALQLFAYPDRYSDQMPDGFYQAARNVFAEMLKLVTSTNELGAKE